MGKYVYLSHREIVKNQLKIVTQFCCKTFFTTKSIYNLSIFVDQLISIQYLSVPGL